MELGLIIVILMSGFGDGNGFGDVGYEVAGEAPLWKWSDFLYWQQRRPVERGYGSGRRRVSLQVELLFWVDFGLYVVKGVEAEILVSRFEACSPFLFCFYLWGWLELVVFCFAELLYCCHILCLGFNNSSINFPGQKTMLKNNS